MRRFAAPLFYWQNPPNLDGPNPVGPLEPVIRKALERVRWTAGPGQSDSWVLSFQAATVLSGTEDSREAHFM
ncbi:hypothetical protein MGR01S_23660 [Meiothermus granaticius NBRC 107808]|nr:hypothetical protein MGR01S_23660 [Meiothermus granaticius NBRC 107808]